MITATEARIKQLEFLENYYFDNKELELIDYQINNAIHSEYNYINWFNSLSDKTLKILTNELGYKVTEKNTDYEKYYEIKW